MEEKKRKQEARWLQDKSSLDGLLKPKLNQKTNQYYYITDEDCIMARVTRENADRWIDEKNMELEPRVINDLKEKEPVVVDPEFIKELFFDIQERIEYYMDDTPENIVIYSLWLIGTAFHNQFNSYPYLFLNAMRGSGKSRLLKLLSFLGDGRYTSSLTEPIIFRTKGFLAIDEIEGIGGKDKQGLRELLNASYKKGMTIMRAVKKKDITGETMKIEEFECYRPIAMANIWGMEEVLGDRCLIRILEKSDNPIKTKLIECFDCDMKCLKIQKNLNQCRLCHVVTEKMMYKTWNDYICPTNDTKALTSLHTYTTLTTQEQELFNKINETGIYGRNLELFFPLFIIANKIDQSILDITLSIAKDITNEKRDSEMNESIDVALYNYIAEFCDPLQYYSLKEMIQSFKSYSNGNEDWLNEKWLGRALKRLNLITDKRRKAHGREVILNVAKAKEKIKMFKTGGS